MKATLESTSKVVTLTESSGSTRMQARIWEGCTEKGVRFHAYIVRVAVAKDEDNSQFEAELKETRAPSADVAAIPMRMIL